MSVAKLDPRRRSIGPTRLGVEPASGGSQQQHRLEKCWPEAHRRQRPRQRPGARASATPSRLRAPSPAPCLPREVKARTNDGLECNLYSQNSGGLSLHTYTWNLHSATDCVLNFEKNATRYGAAGQKCNVQLLLLLRRRDTSETPRQMPTIQSTGSMSASVEAASTSAAARSGRRLALGLGGPSPSARAWCVERLRMHSFGRSSERHGGSSGVRSTSQSQPRQPQEAGQGGELRHHQARTLCTGGSAPRTG